MAYCNASSSASLSSDGATAEDRILEMECSNGRKPREVLTLHRTISSPGSAFQRRPTRSSTCPSRPINCIKQDSFPTSRSLRSVSSPSRMSLFAQRQSKRHSLLQNASSSVDFNKFRRKQPRLLSTQNSSELNSQDNWIDTLQVSNSTHIFSFPRTSKNRVSRSVSSPECLLPRLNQCATDHDVPCNNSPSSPGILSSSRVTPNSNHYSENGAAARTSSTAVLSSPSVSFAGDFQHICSDRSVQTFHSSVTTGISGSLESSLYSSRNSTLEGTDGESLTATGIDGISSIGRHIQNTSFNSDGSSLWPGEPLVGISLRLQEGSIEDRPRLSQLALSHFSSRDLSSVHFKSPPPSYEKLCNPEALPTYQEALEDERRGKRKGLDQRMVFTLPAVPDFSISHTDPLLQEAERSFSGGILSSLAADLSDSEGGYTTILDAIPIHPARESCPTVPVRFISRLSLRRLRFLPCRSLCMTSLCNKSLVKKELNRRWPFIVSAVEDERCPGLLLIECSSNLAVAQLPDVPRSADGLISGNFFPSSSETASAEHRSTTLRIEQSEHTLLDSVSNTATADAGETTALNNHVMFYLCGKCVSYDSFDADNVRTHIEYDCTGPVNKWANISELYLVMRAFCFVLVIILVLMWLPVGDLS